MKKTKQMKQNSTLLKVDQHIARVEDLIEKLLADLSIEDMSSYERFDILVRCLGLSQRAMALRQTCEVNESEDTKESLITSLANYLLGKERLPSEQQLSSEQIVETGLAPIDVDEDDEDENDEND